LGDRFGEGQVGRHALRVVGAPREDEPAGGLGSCREFGEETRLADAGLG